MHNISEIQEKIRVAIETGTIHIFEVKGRTISIEGSIDSSFDASLSIDGKYLYTISCINAPNLAGFVVKQVAKELRNENEIKTGTE